MVKKLGEKKAISFLKSLSRKDFSLGMAANSFFATFTPSSEIGAVEALEQIKNLGIQMDE